MKLHVARRKILASIFATIIGLQSIAYGQPSIGTAKVYWTTRSAIIRADLDGSNPEPLVTELPRAWDIALDLVGGKVYWTDSHGGIHRAGQDGSGVEDLLDGVGARWIALDARRGRMYWTNATGIQRASLDGSSVEALITPEGGYPESLVLDLEDAMMYWIDYGGDDWSAYEFHDPIWDDYGFTAMKHAGLDDDSTTPEFYGRPPFGLAEDMVVNVPESIPTFASIFRTSPEPPAASHLGPSYPNPFNADTRIAYHVAQRGPVRLEVYNVLGQPVRTLVNKVQDAGSYEVHWDGRNQQGTTVASGVYLTRLHHPGGVHSLRLLFLR